MVLRICAEEFIGIPYLNKVSGRDKTKEKPSGKAEYAQAGREACQQYLVDLIRAVVSGTYVLWDNADGLATPLPHNTDRLPTFRETVNCIPRSDLPARIKQIM
jgi:hypothetical protein